MAQTAEPGNVAASMTPPNYREAVKKIRTIPAMRKKMSEKAGDISAVFDKIAGLRVHKGAARVFGKLDDMEPAERADWMRSFNGLAAASGWDESTSDLADLASNEQVRQRMSVPGDGDDDDDKDEAEEKGEDPEPEVQAQEPTPEPAAATKSRISPALAEARKHLGATAH